MRFEFCVLVSWCTGRDLKLMLINISMLFHLKYKVQMVYGFRIKQHKIVVIDEINEGRKGSCLWTEKCK